MVMIYTLSEYAKSHCMTWDEAFEFGEIEPVQVFDTFEKACAAFDAGNFDPELYGVG